MSQAHASFRGTVTPQRRVPCLTHVSRKQAGAQSETASLRREVGGNSAKTGKPFFRGDLRELGHGGRVTVSSEGRPHGRAVRFFRGATGAHLPIRQAACRILLLQDAMREQIGSEAGQRAEGSHRLRPVGGKSRLPGRAVAGPSVSRDRAGRRRGRCTACAWQVSQRPCARAWRGAGGEPGVPPSPAFLPSHPQRCGAHFLLTLWKLEWLVCLLGASDSAGA